MPDIQMIANSPRPVAAFSHVVGSDGWVLLAGQMPMDPEACGKITAHSAEYEKNFANPFKAAERGFIDEVIMPHSTRRRVARAFAALRGKQLENPWKKHDNIPL